MEEKQIEQIAIVAHEANRAYCATIDDNSQLPWSEAPEWQRRSAIDGVRFHLRAHAAGETPSPSASHDNWLAEKEREGWKFGPVKDAEKREHPCFVPYDQLPIEQRRKDYIFGAIVAAFVPKADVH